MKQICTILILALAVLSFRSYSQPKVGIGIKGGYNMSWFIMDVDGSVGPKNDNHIGLYSLIRVNKKLGIQPEAIFSRQGVYYTPPFSINPNFDEYLYDFTYLNFPVMVKYFISKGFNVYAGPQYGMVLNADGDEVDPDQYKKSDFALCTGIALDFRFGVSMDVRYNHGLMDIQDDPGLPQTRTRGIQFSLGVRLIKFGKK